MFFLYIFSAPVRCIHSFPRPWDPAACADLIACLASHLAEFWEEICKIWQRQDYVPPVLSASVEPMRDTPDVDETEAEALESTLVVDSEDSVSLLPPPQDVVPASGEAEVVRPGDASGEPGGTPWYQWALGAFHWLSRDVVLPAAPLLTMHFAVAALETGMI